MMIAADRARTDNLLIQSQLIFLLIYGGMLT